MNKIIISAVFIFWTGISFFYANTLINKNVDTANQKTVNNNLANSQPSTLALELANHNTKKDCWLAIDGKIYDVTSYIYSHPGGANEILKYCGQDGTKAFASKDKFIPQDHSSTAYAMLADYYIGDMYLSASDGKTSGIGNSALVDNTNNNIPAPTPAPAPTPVTYTLTTALVAQHNTASDCWVTGNNNVFNVTSYIRLHPGGQGNITAYCGKDIQAAFNSQGHSANASSIFASYKIGTLGSSVPVSNTTPTPPPSQNSGRGHDDDDHDDDD